MRKSRLASHSRAGKQTYYDGNTGNGLWPANILRHPPRVRLRTFSYGCAATQRDSRLSEARLLGRQGIHVSRTGGLNLEGVPLRLSIVRRHAPGDSEGVVHLGRGDLAGVLHVTGHA